MVEELCVAGTEKLCVGGTTEHYVGRAYGGYR